jgi:hypothetical protein
MSDQLAVRSDCEDDTERSALGPSAIGYRKLGQLRYFRPITYITE